MLFMNDYDIDEAQWTYGDHPVLGPAVQTLANLREWTNDNSDGWSYWPKPARAAARLMELIRGDGTWQARQDVDQRATSEAYRKALAPIKAFRTRHGANFEIIAV